MQVRLLGPVDVVVNGTARPVHGLRRKAVLAALALHGGAIVSTGRLVDIVWGGTAPSTAVNTLQRHVSHLRGVLGSKAAICARPPGYQLRLDDPTDAQLAEQLLRQGMQSPDPLCGAQHLESALALWRGPSLAGVDGLAWLEEQAARLDLLRLQVERATFETRLAAGEHAQLVPRLEQMAADHPLDEQIHRQLMLALYRCARQADALAVYHRLQRTLDQELGIRPGQALRDLQTAILRQDPALDATARAVAPAVAPPAVPVPAQLPLPVPGFTGRETELAELDAMVQADPAGLTPVVISAVSGTAGVGKTALAVHWAHRVAARFPDGQLYVNLRGFDPSGSAMDHGEALRGFLEAFGVTAPRIPGSLSAQAGLYRSLLAGKRVLVVLDNARDAEQVRSLLPGSPGCLAIVTSRDRLGGLAATHGGRPLTLDLFTIAEARDLLARRIDADRVAGEPAAVDDIITSCARLPLALAIVAARAAAHPGFPLTVLAAELRDASAALNALQGGDAVTDVRAVFSWSCRTLSADAARLFRLLGLHPGPDISAPAAASLAGTAPGQAGPGQTGPGQTGPGQVGPGQVGPGQVGTALAELARGHLLTERAPGRYALHDLLRAYAAEQARAHESGDARGEAVHRMLDHYLHTAQAAALCLRPRWDPVTTGPPRPGVTCEEAGDDQQALAWFTAERQVLLAAVARIPAGWETYAWRLASALSAFLDRQGHWQDLQTAQAAALAAAQRQGDPMGQAAAHHGLGLAYAGLNRFDDARAHYLLALDLLAGLGNHAAQAQAHLGLAWACGAQGRRREALDHSRQSLAHYQAAGNRAGQASAHNNIAWYLAEGGSYDEALPYCRRALTIVRELGDLNNQAHTCDTLGYIYRHLGRHQQAIACYQQALDLFRATGDRYSEATGLSYLGDSHDAAGDTRAALRAWTRALDILNQLDHPDAGQVRAKLLQRTA